MSPWVRVHLEVTSLQSVTNGDLLRLTIYSIRKNNMAYNETPTLRIIMSPKLIKFLVKGSLSLAVSAAIGYAIKAEKRIEEAIDEHYDTTEDA